MSIIDEIYYAECKCFPEPFSKKDLEELISNPLGVFLTEQVGGKPAAFALGRAVADEGELFRIAVLEEYRRRGIAVGLLEKFHKELKKRGAEKCFLEVRKKNAAARALYEKLGYEILREIPRYYPDDDGVSMMKRL